MATIPSFSSLDEQTQQDLIAWLNLAAEDASDRRRLAKLHAEGRFKAWDCPRCGTRVYLGEPQDWRHFQGVHQADYTSYPAVTQASEAWCDHCRCYHQNDMARYEASAEEIFGY